jgi:hypothetical protein
MGRYSKATLCFDQLDYLTKHRGKEFRISNFGFRILF